MFTRRTGGVSVGAYSGPRGGGFNLGDHVGDSPEAVAANRAILAGAIGAAPVWMRQVHGCAVALGAVGEAPEADALVVVGARERPPAVLVADCVPVLLAAESGEVRAAVHVGRKGLVLGVLGRALDLVAARTAEPVHAAVGPHNCGACYEVGEDLAEEAERYGARGVTRWGTPSIDLAAGIRRQLTGIPTWEAAACTFEDPDLYSYRRDGVTGRGAGVVLADTP